MLGTSICENIPCAIINIISTLFNVLKIGITIIVIIYAMLDAGKIVIAGNSEDSKKNRKILIKRILNLVLVYFVIYIVIFMVQIFAPEEEANTCLKIITKTETTCAH